MTKIKDVLIVTGKLQSPKNALIDHTASSLPRPKVVDHVITGEANAQCVTLVMDVLNAKKVSGLLVSIASKRCGDIL